QTCAPLGQSSDNRLHGRTAPLLKATEAHCTLKTHWLAWREMGILTKGFMETLTMMKETTVSLTGIVTETTGMGMGTIPTVPVDNRGMASKEGPAHLQIPLSDRVPIIQNTHTTL
ncbi:hypothetical protein M9458_001839, partial [Cirrhinus mrigala]